MESRTSTWQSIRNQQRLGKKWITKPDLSGFVMTNIRYV